MDSKETRLAQVERQAAEPDLWQDPDSAQRIMRDLAALRSDVEQFHHLWERVGDARELTELNDPALTEDLAREVDDLRRTVAILDHQSMFSGRYDGEDAILAVHAGAGGTDAQDWAAMLQRMYTRWGEARGFRVGMISFTEGEEAGVKSVLLGVSGRFAYGLLRAERGVHRLVRLSPFDAAHRRHTSFALVEVWPDVAGEAEVEISDSDLQVDRFRAAGAGGQHVQKNETAVRITHLPTGIVVMCQNERSQKQNLESAMKVLRARLLAIEQQRLEAEMAALKGVHVDAGWGNQIRSYVLHPYQMVKDHRTNYETGNAQAVMDGRLDEFMIAFLRGSAGREEGQGG